MTDAKTKAATSTDFDPSAGQADLRTLEAALRAMPADEVSIPNSDVQESAIAALKLVRIVRDPVRQARFALLPPELLAKDIVDELERAAWAAWYAHTLALTGSAQTGGVRVDAALYEAAGQHLIKMLRLLEYHVGSVAEVAAEIADIRGGTGYHDRASDLVRVAGLWERWRGELEGDKRFFDPGDGDKARELARSIVSSLRDSLVPNVAQQNDLRNRAWSLLSRRYEDIRAAGVFVFRNEPAEQDLFVPLRQAVHPRGRARNGSDQPPPVVPVARGSPATAVQP